MQDFYSIKGHRFSLQKGKAGMIQTIMFYYMVFKALEGDTLADSIVQAIMKSEGVAIIKDVDDKQVYPPENVTK